MSGKQYHNLDGWMRDVQRALRDGDTRSYELAELLIEVDTLVDTSDEPDAGVEDADEPAGGEPDPQMVLPDVPDRPRLGGPDEGHAASGIPPVVRAPTVGSPLERVRRLAQQGARGVRDPMVRTRTRVSS